MKIAMFAELPTFTPALPNGISSFIQDVSRQLVRLGHKVHIFEPCLYLGQPKQVKIQPNLIKHHVFSIGVGKYKGFKTSLPFGTIFRKMEEKFDVIHAHGPIIGVAASALGKKMNCVKLITYHTPGEHYSHYAPPFLPMRYKTIVDLLEKIVYNSFDLMLTPCEAVRTDLVRRGFDAHKLFVLPNCVDLHANHKRITDERMQAIRNQYGLNGKKIVLFLGRMSPEKRVHDIIKLVPKITREEPDTHFLMVGKGPYLEYYRALGQRIAPTDITFTGYVPNEELSNILRMSSLGLIFVDGAQVFDITLLNYWSNHLAVCARRAGGMGDVINHYENGVLFNKPTEAYSHIVSLLQDEALRQKLATKGYETVESKYSVERVTNQMLGYYKLAAEKFHQGGKSILTHFLKYFVRKAPK